MKVEMAFTDAIEVGARHRKLDKKKVKLIAESMKAIGLQHPIHVWAPSENTIQLVAGRHRLAAALELGWEKIDCFLVNMDELDRDLWQIDENLMRADLTVGERADHTSRRGKIIKARKKLSAKLANNSKGGPKDMGQVEFVAETAAMTMKSIRAVARDKHRGDNIAPDVMEAIKNMPAYKIGAELDAIADLNSWDQGVAVELVKSGEAKNFREAKAFLVPDQEAQKAGGAWVVAARKGIRESNARPVRIPNAEEREAMAVEASTAETLDEMGTYYEKERAELRRMGFVIGKGPGQQRDHSQLGYLKTAWRCADDPARAAFVEWAVDALRLGMRNRDDD